MEEMRRVILTCHPERFDHLSDAKQIDFVHEVSGQRVGPSPGCGGGGTMTQTVFAQGQFASSQLLTGSLALMRVTRLSRVSSSSSV